MNMDGYHYSLNGFLYGGHRIRPRSVTRATIKTDYVISVRARSNARVHRVVEAFAAHPPHRSPFLMARYLCGDACAEVTPLLDASPFTPCERCDELHYNADTPWQVYVHWAADGRALYVGQSTNLTMRRRVHAKSSPWWPEVAAHEVISRHANKVDALAAEAFAIRELEPVHNIRHNRKRVAA